MLFNSYIFIFGFLPVVLLIFFWLGRISRPMAAAWLAAASFAFYSWWDSAQGLLLLGSITANYAFGVTIVRSRSATARKLLLALGVGANLALLGYFKYTNFLLAEVAPLLGADGLAVAEIALPLGISFFTFTQIAFLVDASRGEASEYNPIHYALFVTYFPHLIAGPILHHREMMPQFADPSIYRPQWDNLAVGSTVFVIGLFKKLAIADTLVPYVEGAFGPEAGEPRLFAAWAGVLAYTLQIYFDFSGYSDMAIGLSRMFGVRLPLNFNSPYKSANIIEFWRRWHMTLSRFLRDYLYIPLGGNRRGAVRQSANVMATMLLGGLWHGAGWTFVIWGGLHGLYLAVNHGWRHWRGRLSPAGRAEVLAGHLLTFLAVMVAWVFFRADSLGEAVSVLRGMAGLNGVSLHPKLAAILGAAGDWVVLSDAVSPSGILRQAGALAGYLAIAWLMPNTQEIMRNVTPALTGAAAPRRLAAIVWKPDWRWAAVMVVLLVVVMPLMMRDREFLYFRF